MPDTLRYRASSRYSYGRALLALVECARGHDGPEFTFGPASLAALESSGLAVSGDDLTAPAAALARIPGLVQEQETPHSG